MGCGTSTVGPQGGHGHDDDVRVENIDSPTPGSNAGSNSKPVGSGDGSGNGAELHTRESAVDDRKTRQKKETKDQQKVKDRQPKKGKKRAKQEKGADKQQKSKMEEVQEDKFITGFDEEHKKGLGGMKRSGAAAAAAALESKQLESEKAKNRKSAGPKNFLGPAKGHNVSFDLDEDDDIEALESSSNEMIDVVIQEIAEDEEDYGDFDPSKFKVANSKGADKNAKMGFMEDSSNDTVLIIDANNEDVLGEPASRRPVKSSPNSTRASSGRPTTTGTLPSDRFHMSDEQLMKEITLD